MTEVQKLASFIVNKKFSDLSEDAVRELKIRLLDSLGCALGAMQGTPVQNIKRMITDFGGNPLASMIGGQKTSPERASFYNSALVRYLDFNDSFLAKNETCHPSDNIGSVLAASEFADRNGKDFLTALAIAYQVQCRLSEEAPVRDKGFDHTVQGAYGAASGAAYALGLNADETANAIAIAATAYNALRVTRTGNLSNWKGLAFPSTGWTSTHSAFLAKYGITGPEEVFEGNKGFKESIAGDFHINWGKENLEKVRDTIIKKYNAEIHSQSTLEGLQELKEKYSIDPEQIKSIELNTFDVAFNIIGGGEEGGKKNIRTKEEADHSLPYMMSVLLLDDQLMPAQYQPERIASRDVQELLKKVTVKPKKEYSERFPNEMACDIKITMKDGRTYSTLKTDYEGFLTKPASWESVIHKFRMLATPFVSVDHQNQIIDIVQHLEEHTVRELMDVLNRAGHKSVEEKYELHHN